MKSVKRISSLLLALLMILTMSVTTFAAGATGTTETKGTITIANPVKDRTYTAYKIFDVVYSGKNYSYTIDRTTNEWFDTVNAYAETTGKGLKLTQVNETSTYIVETESAFSVSDFSSVLQKVDTSSKTKGKTLNDDGQGKASVSNLDLGYYFVTSGSGALCNLTTTNPIVTIHDKMNVPFEKKVNKPSANVGDTVAYTITGEVPEYEGFSSYTYLITDTMSKELTFNKDVTVTVGGEDKTSECTPKYNVENNANKFTLSIPVKEKEYKVGAKIEVTYTATLNENAIAKVSNNEATLTYSNDPTTDRPKTTTPQVQKVYSSKIQIDKYETGKTETKLKGAEFVLYRLKSDNTSKEYFSCDDTKKVTWVDTIDKATHVTTDDKGVASFDGLADDTYYLEETKAPEGYNPLEKPQKIEVKGDANNEKSLTKTAEVANSTGTLLPSTGGMGTTLFYVIGGIFVLASVVLLITRKRMEKVEK